jgi:tRNA 2-selenouridine synthase
MSQEIDINTFLKITSDFPVIDVRTPSEFKQGRIPGAYNIPLFSDSERKSVGTTYAKRGRQTAILEGLDFAGPKLKSYVKKAGKIAIENRLLVHCWRGGMRSASMAWLFETSGIQCQILEGGYKSFRTKVLNYMNESFPFIVIGGLTGSGKTEALRSLALKDQQILDLESLAHHKGSAFGHLGESAQNTNEQFENDIFWNLYSLDHQKSIWLEDESRGIGKNTIPGGIYRSMQQAPVILLDVPLKFRLQKLVDNYAKYPEEQYLESIEKISKRLGGKITHEAVQAIHAGDYQKTAELVLQYYDKTYQYGLSQRKEGTLFKLQIREPLSADELSEQILQFSRQLGLTWKLSN